MKKKKTPKSFYILIASAILMMSVISFYFIDANKHLPTAEQKNTYEQNAKERKNINAELSVALDECKNNPTSTKKWNEFIAVIKKHHKTNRNHVNYNRLINQAEHILSNYDLFHDTEALQLITEECKWAFEKKFNRSFHQFDAIYIKLLYELKETSKARKVEQQSNKKKLTEIPKQVTKWINTELSTSTKKPLDNYNATTFFKKGTAKIIGYIKDYNGNQTLSFKTGLINISNHFSNKTYPKVVTIHPDGRFEAEFTLEHPVYSAIEFNNQFVNFYLEPEQTLALIIETNYNELDSPYFLGDLATINQDILEFDFKKRDWKTFFEKAKKTTPLAFKKEELENLDTELHKLETYASQRKIVDKTYAILKNKIILNSYNTLLDYPNNHDKTVTATHTLKDFSIVKNKIPKNYYRFLKDMDLNNQNFLINNEFGLFMNRFEYVPGLKIFLKNPVTTDVLTQQWKTRDSIAKNYYELNTKSLLYNIAKLRELHLGDEASLTKYWNTINQNQNPSFIKIADEVIHELKNTNQKTFKLPNSQARKVYNNLTKEFKNKTIVLIVWTEFVSEYRKKEMFDKMIPASKKYKNDAVFLFVTTPKNASNQYFNHFTQENNLENSISVSADTMNYIDELFHNTSGTGFMAVIDKNQQIIYNDAFSTFFDFGSLKTK